MVSACGLSISVCLAWLGVLSCLHVQNDYGPPLLFILHIANNLAIYMHLTIRVCVSKKNSSDVCIVIGIH